MTLREADEAAQKGLPIIHQAPGYTPIKYTRITQVGYRYDENGHRSGFVQLLDKCGHSVTNADPAHCELEKEPKKETEEKTP
jgi:hypothetical protein